MTTTWKYKGTGKNRYIKVHVYWVQNAVKHTYEHLWNQKIFRDLRPRIPKKAQNREGRRRSKHREEEGRWREGRVGWGRKGRGTERKGKGMEGRGRREGKEERRREGREGREIEGTGIRGEVCVMVFWGDGRPCPGAIDVFVAPSRWTSIERRFFFVDSFASYSALNLSLHSSLHE
jgi:hypothetical protein